MRSHPWGFELQGGGSLSGGVEELPVGEHGGLAHGLRLFVAEIPDGGLFDAEAFSRMRDADAGIVVDPAILSDAFEQLGAFIAVDRFGGQAGWGFEEFVEWDFPKVECRAVGIHEDGIGLGAVGQESERGLEELAGAIFKIFVRGNEVLPGPMVVGVEDPAASARPVWQFNGVFGHGGERVGDIGAAGKEQRMREKIPASVDGRPNCSIKL